MASSGQKKKYMYNNNTNCTIISAFRLNISQKKWISIQLYPFFKNQTKNETASSPKKIIKTSSIKKFWNFLKKKKFF